MKLALVLPGTGRWQRAALTEGAPSETKRLGRAPSAPAAWRSASSFRGGWPAALLVALTCLVSPATAQTFPAFRGFVVDAADVIPSAAEADLTATLERFQRDTGHQLAVASVPSLQGYGIEEFARRLANRWGVGRRGYNDGVVLLVAPRDRTARIAVGRGLENTLTNGRCALILQNRIIPSFRRGDLPGGIKAGVGAIIAALSKRTRAGVNVA